MTFSTYVVPDYFADMFLALDKDMNGTLSKQELREYADGTLTEIFVERGWEIYLAFEIYPTFARLFSSLSFILQLFILPLIFFSFNDAF